MKYLGLLFCVLIISCLSQPKELQDMTYQWESYDESTELAECAKHESERMQFKLLQSKVTDRNKMLTTITKQVKDFDETEYQKLKPLIYDQDILTIQSHVKSGQLSYENLTKWYLYRIAKYESNRETTLNAIISINPKAVEEAKRLDQNKTSQAHPIYGMPILLKDNINTSKMPTTAGAEVLKNNHTSDAFIVAKIKEKGGIILGKANLSEWAYFFCDGCPLGYSAMGGQTLNPYGRKQFETGGSSSGSGVAMAANYAAAAVGTETAGSILSPASQNSIVGLKPTIGLLSRSGIVPISSTLDTPGPMTRSVMDNAILLAAMSGEDTHDPVTKYNPKGKSYTENLKTASLKGKRFGVIKAFLEDSIYKETVAKIEALGAITVEFEAGEMNFEKFVTFLNADMKVDLPKYLKAAVKEIRVRSVEDIVAYNQKDPTIRMPYGQTLFEGIVAEDINEKDFTKLKADFLAAGIKFFETPMKEHQLDAILSINNWNAAEAAMAKYPCLTVPMGYKESGEPLNLTFIARPFQEDKLLEMGYAFEQGAKVRRSPVGFE